MRRHDAPGLEGRAAGGALDRRDWPAPPRNEVETELRQALVEASQRAADEVALRRVWSRLSQIPDLVSAPSEEMRSFRRVRWPFVAGASPGGGGGGGGFFLPLPPPAVCPRPGAPPAPPPPRGGRPRPQHAA